MSTPAPAAAHSAVRTYVSVFAALLVLTGLTVAASFVDLGPVNTPVALIIAGAKATLVLVWFMHLRVSHRLVWVFVVLGILFLALLMGITVAEGLNR